MDRIDITEVIELCPVTGEEHDCCYDCCCHGDCRKCGALAPYGFACDLDEDH